MTKLSTNVLKTACATSLIAVLAIPLAAQADTLRRTVSSPHFTVNSPGATINMTWYSPVPTTVVLQRYTGGYNSNPGSTIVYEGPPPSSLSLTGGGRTGGGRYTIRAKNAAGKYIGFTVEIVGPSTVKNW